MAGDEPVSGPDLDDGLFGRATRGLAAAAAAAGIDRAARLDRPERPGSPTRRSRRRSTATGDPDLALALEWSEAVNRSIEEIVKDVPPFPFVRESLESMAGKADVMVVSATPGEALEREWDEHDLREHVAPDRRPGVRQQERAPGVWPPSAATSPPRS